MKALATDFDGTIYFRDNQDGYFKDTDIQAIKDFQQKGYLMGTCTGRPFLGTYLPTKGKIDFDFYIVSSGGCIKDKDLNIIYKKCMPKNIVKEIHDRYITKSIIYVQCNDYLYVSNAKGRTAEELIEFKSIDMIPDEETYSISLICDSISTAHRLAIDVKERYGNILDSFQNVDSVDVVMKGCSKGAAIKLVKELLNIDEIYGIGDSYNDIPMLVEADYSFTFNASPQEVKNQADDLVDSVEEAIHKIESM